MAILVSIQPPFPYFTATDGSALEDGYIWIGQKNQDPQVNPASVYYDAGLTILAAQPIRTSGGYAINNGTPVRLYVNGDYSIRVQNKNGSLVYSSPGENAFFGGEGSAAINAEGNGVQTTFPVSSTPRTVYINGIYQNQNTYSVVGSNVVFTEAPPATSVIEFLI